MRRTRFIAIPIVLAMLFLRGCGSSGAPLAQSPPRAGKLSLMPHATTP